VAGFAAETEMLVENAQAKLAAKNCDMIIANFVGEGADLLGGENNEVLVLTGKGTETWPRLSKQEVARRIVAKLAGMLPGDGR
jgi:phosphopantothenoylcysteine decarboxylase / phosphopantothenate---cysteine ligase